MNMRLGMGNTFVDLIKKNSNQTQEFSIQIHVVVVLIGTSDLVRSLVSVWRGEALLSIT